MTQHIRLEDLPPEVRHRIEDSRKAERAKAVKATQPGTKAWLCCACGEVMPSMAACVRHLEAFGHRRVECLDGPAEGE